MISKRKFHSCYSTNHIFGPYETVNTLIEMFLICFSDSLYIEWFITKKNSVNLFSVFFYFELKYTLEDYLFYQCKLHEVQSPLESYFISVNCTRYSHPWKVIVQSCSKPKVFLRVWSLSPILWLNRMKNISVLLFI